MTWQILALPIGQAARHGVRENDKIMTINAKTPRNVDDAVGVIKQAGNQIKLVVLREEDVGPEDSTLNTSGSGHEGSIHGGSGVPDQWASTVVLQANCTL